MSSEDDKRLRAIIADSRANNRTNPAVNADTEHAPVAWTEAEEAEFVSKTYGSAEERIAKLIEEANRRNN